jgi:hypothetical protein
MQEVSSIFYAVWALYFATTFIAMASHRPLVRVKLKHRPF